MWIALMASMAGISIIFMMLRLSFQTRASFGLDDFAAIVACVRWVLDDHDLLLTIGRLLL
jgi:hypothetical protein